MPWMNEIEDHWPIQHEAEKTLTRKVGQIGEKNGKQKK